MQAVLNWRLGELWHACVALPAAPTIPPIVDALMNLVNVYALYSPADLTICMHAIDLMRGMRQMESRVSFLSRGCFHNSLATQLTAFSVADEGHPPGIIRDASLKFLNPCRSICTIPAESPHPPFTWVHQYRYSARLTGGSSAPIADHQQRPHGLPPHSCRI